MRTSDQPPLVDVNGFVEPVVWDALTTHLGRLNPAFRLFSAAYAITFPLILIALVALYWREAQEAGVFGAVAFCVAVTGTVALAGDMWNVVKMTSETRMNKSSLSVA